MYCAVGDSDYACFVYDRRFCSELTAAVPDGDCKPWGKAVEELLGATLFGTAGCRPNRDCGPLDEPRRDLLGGTQGSCGPEHASSGINGTQRTPDITYYS